MPSGGEAHTNTDLKDESYVVRLPLSFLTNFEQSMRKASRQLVDTGQIAHQSAFLLAQSHSEYAL